MGVQRGGSGRTVGVFRWVLERTMSRKSPAVGTGAMALSPLVDIVGRDQGFFFPCLASLLGNDRTYEPIPAPVGVLVPQPARPWFPEGWGCVLGWSNLDAQMSFPAANVSQGVGGNRSSRWEFRLAGTSQGSVTVTRRYGCHR